MASAKPTIVLHQAGKSVSDEEKDESEDPQESSPAHQAEEPEQTEGQASEAEKTEEETIKESIESAENPLEKAISIGLKRKEEQAHHKDTNFVEASIQQALRIKELEAKIKRLEEQNKANAETVKEQRMIQQVVMPQIISLTQRV